MCIPWETTLYNVSAVPFPVFEPSVGNSKSRLTWQTKSFWSTGVYLTWLQLKKKRGRWSRRDVFRRRNWTKTRCDKETQEARLSWWNEHWNEHESSLLSQDERSESTFHWEINDPKKGDSKDDKKKEEKILWSQEDKRQCIRFGESKEMHFKTKKQWIQRIDRSVK